MKHYRKIFWAISFIVLLSFCFLPEVTKARAGSCGKWEGIPTITLKLPGQEIIPSRMTPGKKEPLGKGGHGEEGHHYSQGEMKTVTLSIEDFEKYHGGIGPGNALGFRACQIALAHLYPGEIAPRKDQFVVSGSEKDCPADAVTYVTGARYGKGALGAFNGNVAFDQNVGDFNFIFASMSNGKVVKLINRFEWPQEFIELHKKGKTLTPEEQTKSEYMTRCLCRYILTAPEKGIFEVIAITDFNWKAYKEQYLKQ
ncbi:MAG TPA: formylmethanofuran dehydrogenase subunit E family protein [Thermodesulfobacteriota bacterium]|nr:formylmethanofuran dehydrogenase subunit E family protein [Thermodesulfobacteriota bacterium]